jgi:hypothetical protein
MQESREYGIINNYVSATYVQRGMGNSRDPREVNNGQRAGGNVLWYGRKEIDKGKQVVLSKGNIHMVMMMVHEGWGHGSKGHVQSAGHTLPCVRQ